MGFCTVTPFRVDKVLYGTYNKKYLNVAQNFAIVNDQDGNKVKYAVEYYDELKKENYYILYLVRWKSNHWKLPKNTYAAGSIYYGTINLSEDGIIAMDNPFIAEQLNNIRRGAIERFKDQLPEEYQHLWK